MVTNILLASTRVSTLPLASLAAAVMVSMEEPVAHLIVLASGLAGNEIVVPVIGYDCANNCSERINNKIVKFIFIETFIKK
jgi:hypothetical protein